jgi:cell cycle checkpoint protein MEC1
MLKFFFNLVLHFWFMENKPDVSDWLQMRAAFARSNALWSVVGHVIGLGDRHLDNILMLKESGEVMHVDFSFLFDRGKRLGVPEVVPFRLTQNMVDVFGVTGVHGTFQV